MEYCSCVAISLSSRIVLGSFYSVPIFSLFSSLIFGINIKISLNCRDPCSMELSPGAGSSSANGTPSPTFCLFPSNLFSATPGVRSQRFVVLSVIIFKKCDGQIIAFQLSASSLLQSDSSSSSMITPPPSYQAALLGSLKVSNRNLQRDK